MDEQMGFYPTGGKFSNEGTDLLPAATCVGGVGGGGLRHGAE